MSRFVKKISLSAFLLSKLKSEQCGIFRSLQEKLRTGWKENLKNLSEHALLLGTSEYIPWTTMWYVICGHI